MAMIIRRWLLPPLLLVIAGCGSSGGGGGGLERAMAGKSVYDGSCDTCHQLSTYDTAGAAPDLAGQGSLIEPLFAGGPHNGISLSGQEITHVETWVDADFVGKDVYDSICWGCHRLGAYDTSGSAPNLAGRTVLGAHHLGGFTARERQSLNAWVNTP